MPVVTAAAQTASVAAALAAAHTPTAAMPITLAPVVALAKSLEVHATLVALATAHLPLLRLLLR